MTTATHNDSALARPPGWAMALAVAGSASEALRDSWRLLLADLSLARGATVRLALCTLFGGLLLFTTLLCLLAVLVVALMQSGQSPYLALSAAAGACMLIAFGLWCWSARLIRDASLQATREQMADWFDASPAPEIADVVAQLRAQQREWATFSAGNEHRQTTPAGVSAASAQQERVA
ncbi:MAG: hypothetical protein KDI48_05940 [Xanthomonadales bacterium]|nr:hypothetical protein [Xanthomonadales bacterium]